MPLWRWSPISSSNGNVDPTINFLEGQPPSSLNDSARALMAAIAMYRDDISAAIVTGGISTAYTVASNSSYDSLAHLANQMIAFTPHATNGAGPVTINVDGQGAKPLRTAPNVELQSNVLIQGTPYCCTYNNSDGAFYLHSLASNTYGIPLAAGMDYWGTTTPSSAFAFPTGQAISRATYATLFTIMGTTYGVGDGSTTFNLPDKTGRVSAMQEASSTRLPSTYFGGNSTVLGAVGGSPSHTLATTELPAHTHSGTTGAMNSNASHSHSVSGGTIGGTSTTVDPGPGSATVPLNATAITINATNTDHTHNFTTDNGTGGGAAHAIVQPTIVSNYILRVI
jgi:microcystin-dependent protein